MVLVAWRPRVLRWPRLMPYPQEPTTAPRAQAYAADAPQWWRRKPTPLTVAIGAAAALALAILLGLLLTPSMERSNGDEASRRPAAAAADGLIQFNLRAAPGAYQAPSASGVERAYLAAQAAFRAGGVSELAHQGLLCFRGLERKPSYEAMDYCIAFD